MSINLKSHPDKDLIKHLLNVGNECKRIILSKDLSLNLITKEKLGIISYLIGISHDFGKSTSYFQNKLPPYCIKHPCSHHGLISALFGYTLIEKYYKNKTFSMIAFIVIKKHHGNLESPLEDISSKKNDLQKQILDLKEEERIKSLKTIYEELLKGFNLTFKDCFTELERIINSDLEDFIEDNFEDLLLKDINNSESIERFLLTNLLYSILIDSDKKDAANIKTDYFKNNLSHKISVKDYLNKLKRVNPDKFDETIEINKLRTEFFNEIINNTEIKKDNYLYSLTAPTGIGKTFTSFAFANKLKNLFPEGKRIIYCLPYTSIIDQNYSIIDDIFDYNLGEDYKNKATKYLLKHHHLTPLKLLDDVKAEKESEDYLNYFEQKLLLESWESGNIVTTFIQLFQSVISNKNAFMLKFHNIVNSIIILDEIQTLRVDYYKLIGEVFKIFAERFNTYILFLTATQPKIIEKSLLINLVDDYKYSKNKEFDRVDLEIVNKLHQIKICDFIDWFKKSFTFTSGIIICNKVKIALNIYQELSEYYKSLDYIIYSLTTNIVPFERKRIIEEINQKLKNNEKILVISTQLVEAGVDFSFGSVYRDLAPIDSIIQAAGRSNRNNELKVKNKKGKVFLYNLIDDKNKEGNSIYDIKLIQDTRDKLKKEFYSGADFINLSMDYFFNINNENESNKLLLAIKKLNYNIEKKKDEIPIKDFELIQDDFQKIDLIISFNQEIDNKISRLVEVYEYIKKAKNNIYNMEKEFEEIENLKKDLANYKVSIYKNNEKRFNSYIRESLGMKYIPFEYFNSVYDQNIGIKLDVKDLSYINF